MYSKIENKKKSNFPTSNKISSSCSSFSFSSVVAFDCFFSFSFFVPFFLGSARDLIPVDAIAVTMPANVLDREFSSSFADGMLKAVVTAAAAAQTATADPPQSLVDVVLLVLGALSTAVSLRLDVNVAAATVVGPTRRITFILLLQDTNLFCDEEASTCATASQGCRTCT